MSARAGDEHRERGARRRGPTVSEGLSRPAAGHVPVLGLGDVLLVTLQGDLYDSTAHRLQQDLAEAIARSRVTGVVIDISGVEIVDSFLGRVLAEIAAQAELLAARTVVAGMRPAVAVTLVELGLALPGLRTALTTEAAMELLARPVVPPRSGGGREGGP
ncbi:anti-anti-sigma factor [Streptomyces sp. XY152]|nr:anti-anti-sigma factor [Streptomyces sp. XY152]